MIEYTLTRSSRKTIGLYVRDGVLEVRAPKNVAKSEIDKFVAAKEKWITVTLAKSQTRLELRSTFELNYGDMVVYKGETFPIVARSGNRVGFDDTAFYMPEGLSNGQIKAACVQVYNMLAKRDITAKTLDFAKKMGVMPTAIKINNAKTRWGSCSSKRSINFSWRLIMAEVDVIDYVVVHELAHLSEMNHSPRFWAIVENILPDYKARQEKLKVLQKRLSVEDWE